MTFPARKAALRGYHAYACDGDGGGSAKRPGAEDVGICIKGAEATGKLGENGGRKCESSELSGAKEGAVDGLHDKWVVVKNEKLRVT